MIEVTKLVDTLVKQSNKGIDRLGALDITSGTYERTLNNVIASISIIEKLSYTPPKDQPKPKSKDEKEN